MDEKSFLASLFAAAAFASPVLAEDKKVKTWRSFDSLGHDARECKEDVELTTWSELGPEYGIAAEELDAIIAALKKVGATIYLADDITLRSGCGVYDALQQHLFEQVLSESAHKDDPSHPPRRMAHRAGLHGGDPGEYFTALIFPEEVTYLIGFAVAQRGIMLRMYCHLRLRRWAIEDKTKEALEVCAGPKKMWEHYAPTSPENG